MKSLSALALKSLWSRRSPALLTVVTIGLSITLLLGVQRVRTEARQGFASTVAGTDLIVGARAGPVNLLLYSVFHLGDPTNNLSWETYDEIRSWPEVAWTVPLSLGDSHRGHRVVGTTTDFFVHYQYGNRQNLSFNAGAPFTDVHDAVIGADVADVLSYGLGSAIVLTHGTGAAGISDHTDQPFIVTGILDRTGTPVDRSVLVDLRGIEAIHLGWQTGIRLPSGRNPAAGAGEADLTPKSITAFLVGLQTRTAAFAVQREINESTREPLTAVLPGVALQQLWRLVGPAERALTLIGAFVVLVGIAGMVTVLLATLQQRRREMAVLRAIGARPRHVFCLLILESTWLSTAGALVGAMGLYLLIWAGRPIALTRWGLHLSMSPPTSAEWMMLGIAIASGVVAGVLPAWLAYRRTLADGLEQRL